MNAAILLYETRQRAGLTLRGLARIAGTSHATLSAYERARVDPSTETLARMVRAAGFDLDIRLERRIREVDGLARGEELAQVLALAEAFPVRVSPTMDAPMFGHSVE